MHDSILELFIETYDSQYIVHLNTPSYVYINGEQWYYSIKNIHFHVSTSTSK